MRIVDRISCTCTYKSVSTQTSLSLSECRRCCSRSFPSHPVRIHPRDVSALLSQTLACTCTLPPCPLPPFPLFFRANSPARPLPLPLRFPETSSRVWVLGAPFFFSIHSPKREERRASYHLQQPHSLPSFAPSYHHLSGSLKLPPLLRVFPSSSFFDVLRRV